MIKFKYSLIQIITPIKKIFIQVTSKNNCKKNKKKVTEIEI
jgi:hypothetical protein